MSIKANLIREYCKDNGITKEIDFLKDVLIFDDMKNGVSNPYIKEWNLDIKKPTKKQLSALESDADKMERNNEVIATRKNLYGSLEQQIENIIENGLQAEIDRINQIKAKNPKE